MVLSPTLFNIEKVIGPLLAVLLSNMENGYTTMEKMWFLAPENQKEVLTHNIDLKEFALNLTPVPNKFKYFSNDYVTNTIVKLQQK